ncbi:CPBP family intramembrane metalloprotease [bacterium]|nr:CPBP family intramembrane metalloprotease [bacterium]
MTDELSAQPGEETSDTNPDQSGKLDPSEQEKAKPRSILKRVVTFPVISIALAFSFVLGLTMTWTSLIMFIVSLFVPGLHLTQDSAALPILLGGYFFYWFYARVFEKRTVSELSWPGCLSELARGLLLGFWLFTLIMVCQITFGSIRITGRNEWTSLLPMILPFIAFAFMEEILMRGIIFRMLEQWRGTTSAVVFSSLLFGLIHLGNDHATLFSALAISIEAGLLLAAAFVLTRRLWLATGIHIAWNYTQGTIFGANTSGCPVKGLLITQTDGPALLSGGDFGPEASLFAIVIGGLLGVILLRIAVQHGKTISKNQ